MPFSPRGIAEQLLLEVTPECSPEMGNFLLETFLPASREQ